MLLLSYLPNLLGKCFAHHACGKSNKANRFTLVPYAPIIHSDKIPFKIKVSAGLISVQRNMIILPLTKESPQRPLYIV